jgi:hypothetical protein
LGADHVEPDSGRRKYSQQQDNTQTADEPGNDRGIFADCVMGELFAYRSQADGSHHGLVGSLMSGLPLFLSEWTQVV